MPEIAQYNDIIIIFKKENINTWEAACEGVQTARHPYIPLKINFVESFEN